MSRVLQTHSHGADRILARRSAPGHARDDGGYLIPGLTAVRFRDCAGLILLRKTQAPRARFHVPMTTTARKQGADAGGASPRTGAGSRHLRRPAGGVQCCR